MALSVADEVAVLSQVVQGHAIATYARHRQFDHLRGSLLGGSSPLHDHRLWRAAAHDVWQRALDVLGAVEVEQLVLV